MLLPGGAKAKVVVVPSAAEDGGGGGERDIPLIERPDGGGQCMFRPGGELFYGTSRACGGRLLRRGEENQILR